MLRVLKCASFISVVLALFVSPALADQKQKPDSVKARTSLKNPLEAPVRLMVGKEALNVAAKQMYPSPAFYDIDGDGQMELIVGDIFGTLNVYENKNNSGKGDPVWAKHKALRSVDGEKIKVSNW